MLTWGKNSRTPATFTYFLNAFYFVLIAGAPIKAATPLRAEQMAAEIRAVMKAQDAAWNRGDVDGFMNGYARSRTTVFVSGDAVTRGWETVRDRYKKKYATAEQMGRLTFSDLEITLLCPNTAIALGRWQLQRKGDRPRGCFTLLFRRTPEGWRIVYDHTSAASP